jgi:hypothetical protein
VVTEVAADDLPCSEQIGLVVARNLDGCFDHVLEASVGSVQGDPKVCHHLLGLPRNVCYRHSLAGFVERARSGREDEPGQSRRRRRRRMERAPRVANCEQVRPEVDSPSTSLSQVTAEQVGVNGLA